MKTTLTLLGSLGLMALAARAQTFTPAPGYTAQQIYPTSGGQTVAGLAADSAGNLYFEIIDSSPEGVTSLQRLARDPMRPTGFAASAQLLFQYSGSPYSGFVKVYDDELFFSETLNYTIRAIDLRNFTVPATPLTETSLPAVATVSGLQDLAVRSSDFNSGHALQAYISANPSGIDNQVFKLSLSTGMKTAVVDTAGDYSGPLDFDRNNRLIYGKSGSDYGTPKKPGGLFVYSSAEIDGVSGSPLPTDLSHRLTDNYSNSFFATNAGTTLFQAESHFFGNDLLHSYNLGGSGTELLLGTADDPNYDFSGLALNASSSQLFVALTDFNLYPPTGSAIFVLTVPEPGSSLYLGLWAASQMALRRPRRRT